MSKAIRCDRCKGYYQLETIKDDEEVTGIEHIIITDRECASNMAYKERKENIDLCPTCTKSFKFFMDGFDIWTVQHMDEENRKKDTADSEKDGV